MTRCCQFSLNACIILLSSFYSDRGDYTKLQRSYNAVKASFVLDSQFLQKSALSRLFTNV